MIVQLVLSVIVVLGVDFLCAYCSGAVAIELINGFELPCILAILALLLLLAGHGRSFGAVFFGGAQLKAKPLSQLRRTEQALDFALAAALGVCLFFTTVAAVYFYLNIDYRQSLGPNLGTVMLSLYYLLLIATVLLCLKGCLRRTIVSIMAESPAPKTERHLSAREIIRATVKTLVALAAIAAIASLVIAENTVSMQDIASLSRQYAFDGLSLAFILLHGGLLLGVSGSVDQIRQRRVHRGAAQRHRKEPGRKRILHALRNGLLFRAAMHAHRLCRNPL